MADMREQSMQKRRLAMDAHFHQPNAPLRLGEKGTNSVEAWFLGPKAENEYLLTELVVEAIRKHSAFRTTFHPEDPIYITEEVKQSPVYRETVQRLRRHATELFDQLKAHSAPVFSMRSQGHMLWDQVLPAMVGYFGGMLYNQNNVAAEASPVTTQLEIEVGTDLCRMLGFPVPPPDTDPAPGTIVPWGHITCDGSVANIEALWAARNAKFFAPALRAAIREVPALAKAKTLEVKLLDGSMARLIDLDPWTLLNLKIDDIVNLPQVIETQYGIPTATTTGALTAYTVQNIGLIEFSHRFLAQVPYAPVAMVPSTRHYSWPKAGAILGLGQNNLLNIYVDQRGRMEVANLSQTLQSCLQKHVPVIAVVAVIGTTEESAVDPLVEILHIREQFRDQGLDFAVHCDAAWGGYFASMLREDDPHQEARAAAVYEFVPEYPMSEYVQTQYRAMASADSITVDPHKAGYVPYPAGGLCYRNSAARDLVSLAAPVIFHSQSEPTVGIYGIEGSKPGAAVAATYLAHRVIRPDKSGYGKILGQCMWTSKRTYARLLTMARPDDRFKIVVWQQLPGALRNDPVAAQKEFDYIKAQFATPSDQQVLQTLQEDAYGRWLFGEMGSDQVIVTYSFNFLDTAGNLNDDIDKMNALQNTVFELCSPSATTDLTQLALIITNSSFSVQSYGKPFVDDYCRRLGVKNPDAKAVTFNITTTMDPWTTDLPGGGSFLQVVEDALRDAVHKAMRELRYW